MQRDNATLAEQLLRRKADGSLIFASGKNPVCIYTRFARDADTHHRAIRPSDMMNQQRLPCWCAVDGTCTSPGALSGAFLRIQVIHVYDRGWRR